MNTPDEPRDVRIVRRLATELDLNAAAIAELTGIPLDGPDGVRDIHRRYKIPLAAGRGKPSEEQRYAALAAIVGIKNDQDTAFADRLNRLILAKLPVDIAYRTARHRELVLAPGIRVHIDDLAPQEQAA